MRFRRATSGVRIYWILEASNIRPPVGKVSRRSEALILLMFLAPRPGLEPGTYGLTDCPSALTGTDPGVLTGI